MHLMEFKREKLHDLFIINPQIEDKKIYIWISDDKNDLESMAYSINYCIAYNIYFVGFVTNCKKMVNIEVLNKRVYDINEITDTNFQVITENRNNTFYCSVKILNPRLNLSNIVIWGAGNNGRMLYDYFIGKNISINCFIDSDEKKIEDVVNKVPVYGVEKVTNLNADVSLIEATDKYPEIDKIMQEKAPEIDCYIYSHAGEGTCFNLAQLMYMKESIQNRNVYIYGYNYYAKQLSRCLSILDYHFSGFLVEQYQQDEIYVDGETVILPEDLLYCNNFYVVIVSDDKRQAVKRLNDLGFKYCIDYSPIEIMSYNLLYARKNVIDINLGHTYAQKGGMNGIEIYGNMNDSSYKIAVLGGSTTDGKLFAFKSWPEILYNKIKSNNVVVYNAGVSGYTSAQELIKLIRDIILLKPNMVIVYDGYNDTSEINALPGKYFEFTYLKKAITYAQKHMNSDWDFISQNDTSERNDAFPIIGNFENWLMNIEMMHAITVDRGIQFYSFLQPMLSNKRNLTNKEKGRLFEVENFCGLKRTSLMGKQFRKRIGDVVNSHHYIYDLSDIFDDYHDIYMDICHVYEGANEIIASEIIKRIEIVKYY